VVLFFFHLLAVFASSQEIAFANSFPSRRCNEIREKKARFSCLFQKWKKNASSKKKIQGEKRDVAVCIRFFSFFRFRSQTLL
jgi:hypothetical protein